MHRPLWVFLGVAVTLAAGAAVGAGVFYALRQSEGTATTPGAASPTPPPCPAPAAVCREPRVTVETGELRGQCRPAKDGRPEYAAFLGVPYAKAPLGALRFKSPRPMEPWDGVRDAVLQGPRCLQGAVDKHKGSEDCLHLNVYSPWLQRPHNDTLLHVLVHVHGGGMVEGSGNPIRPEYFIANDLVVVTFNYRLSHFGFFNLDSDLAPGNAGIKDMIAALQWVHRNIRHFGGDPEKVTVNGCSSAAAAVHWLALLPETEGLFRAAIIKSGSALLSWGYSERHRDLSDIAMAFLHALQPAATDEQLLHLTNDLIADLAFTFADKHRNKLSPETRADPTVTVERRPDGEEPKLILRDPESYVLRPARSRIPLLMGITSCEYNPMADMYYLQGELLNASTDALYVMLPRSVIPLPDAMADLGLNVSGTYTHNFFEMIGDVQSVMFNLTAVDVNCDTRCRWEQFLSDIEIKVDTVRSMRLHAREQQAPVYAYYYEYPLAGPGCAVHAQDDYLVWPEDEVQVMQLNTTHPLSLNVLRQVTMFTNFVKHGYVRQFITYFSRARRLSTEECTPVAGNLWSRRTAKC
ncbi:hypothetical protein ONE63_001803 [Megalurothrips usitatus]|uniref:Carboxylesterase type B domain-containing protein n=1 Tax=Megalurothrips usitatus TaxID=439358 RepID=A0AAV7XE49_9NEOP|nr:hypothetical protein ONE63_001803 [Megalurothrips usitatus]